MRLGILGGTFDPVHYGHLLMAEICRQQLHLDQVRLIPAGTPPHKPGQVITDGLLRAEMLKMAVAGYWEYEVDLREILRSGASYTVETLLEIRQSLPQAQLFLLLGADSLRDLLTWRDFEQIASLAALVVCNRPGVPLPQPAQVREWVGERIAESVQFVSIPGIDLSASDLRRRVREGLGLRFMTPRAVETMIHQHGLYR